MQKRRLGTLEVSAVGLGCATMTPFYDQPDSDTAIDTLRRARETGADLLDSSDAYGQGRNEELIARAIKGHRNDYVIASKFGNLRSADGSPTSDGRPEYVKWCCERSLKRLETDVIGPAPFADPCHRKTQAAGSQETHPRLRTARQADQPSHRGPLQRRLELSLRSSWGDCRVIASGDTTGLELRESRSFRRDAASIPAPLHARQTQS
jgi:hypothetical protein